MKTWKILNAESADYSRKAYHILCELGEVQEENYSQTELLENINDYDILIVRLGLQVNQDILEKAPRLRYILSATTGTDHIDMEYAIEKGIQVICLKGEAQFLQTIPSTAEHTWALLLALLRHIPAAFSHVQQGGWDRQLFRGHNLLGQKLGILGLGRVGKQVGNYALAFGCETGAYDPYLEQWPNPGIIRFETATALLQWCTILCIHIPYDASNLGFLNRQLLTCLRKGALIINTSRSGIWDEETVTDLLNSGHLAGVATDVIDHEQNPELREKSGLIKYAKTHQNLLITPHIAGATYESMEMTEEFIAKKLFHLLQNNELNQPCAALVES